MKDIKLLESVQCRTMMMMKSLKGKMNEEQLYKRFLLIEYRTIIINSSMPSMHNSQAGTGTNE